MKLKSLFPLLFAIAALAVFGSASPISVIFEGGNGAPVSGTTTPANKSEIYYPYVINVNGSNTTVACDDYFDSVSPGETWTGVESGIGNLSQTLFVSDNSNGTTGTQKYEEAFWLFSQFQTAPPNDNEVNAAINYAMWDLFDGSAPSLNQDGAADTASSYWLTAANDELAGGFAGIDFSNFVVYTPTSWTAGDARPQEFIGEVPEPATLALFGSGLLFLGLFFKRRLAGTAGELSLDA